MNTIRMVLEQDILYIVMLLVPGLKLRVNIMLPVRFKGKNITTYLEMLQWNGCISMMKMVIISDIHVMIMIVKESGVPERTMI